MARGWSSGVVEWSSGVVEKQQICTGKVRKEHDQDLQPWDKMVLVHMGKKSQTWGLVWVTGGPLETIFVKTFFQN